MAVLSISKDQDTRFNVSEVVDDNTAAVGSLEVAAVARAAVSGPQALEAQW
jgi:hypothetical protein